MFNEEETTTEEIPEPTESRLDKLKKRADLMNITYHPNIGEEKLAAKIERAQAGTAEEKDASTPTSKVVPPTYAGNLAMSETEYRNKTRNHKRRQAAQLVRVRVVNMNPNKKEWEGEIISVGSARLGTYKKYVPFNNDAGYHVPYIIFQAMKERMYTQFYTTKDERGNKIRKGKLVPEFSIEVLPPLTEAELTSLAQRQAMAGGVTA